MVIETAISAGHARGLTVIAGAGANSTATAIERQRFAHHSGADATLQVCPYYNRPSQEGLYRHFMAIADAADLPIVLYDVPARTGVSLAIDTVIRLSKHPNIVAIKDATGGLTAPQRILQTTDLVVLSGDDPMILPTTAIGAHGVVSVLSNIIPNRIAGLVESVRDGDLVRAGVIHDDVLRLAHAILGQATNPVGIKTAASLLGFDSGELRLPLCPPPHPVHAGIADALMHAGLLTPDHETLAPTTATT